MIYSVPSGHFTRFYCIKLILFFLLKLYIAKHSYLHLCFIAFSSPLFQASYALNWISILEQKEISSPFPYMKKLNVKFGLIESLLKSLSGCFIYVCFFLLFSFLCCFSSLPLTKDASLPSRAALGRTCQSQLTAP